MSENLIAEINARLNALKDPVSGQNYGFARGIKNIDIHTDSVAIQLRKDYPISSVRKQLEQDVIESLADLDLQGRTLTIDIEQNIVSHSAQKGAQAVSGVKNIIAVASGKGGVGKSTVSANLALALAQAGANVAILDADIYGPSQPRMLGVSGKPDALENKMLVPHQNHGLKIMSIGFMVEEDTPMIWRGPMVTQALEQMLRATAWQQQDEAQIDYLIIDLPPGTGDIQLTLSQKVPVTGAVIVTTPQDIALLDARKAYKMFEKVDVPIFGVIENMSTHVCTQCGHEEAIFGEHGASKMAQEYGLDVLGEIPLELKIRELADSGNPTVAAQPDSATAKRYTDIAMQIAGKLAAKKQDFSSKFPNIVVESS